MRCVTARRYLVAYLSGELGLEPGHDLERHCAGCEPCRLRLEGERRLEERLRSALGGTDAFRERIFERALGSALGSVTAHRARRPALVLLIPAAVSLAGLALWLWDAEPMATSPSPTAARTLESPERPATTMKPTSLLGAAVLASAATATTTSLLLATEGEEDLRGRAATPEGPAPSDSAAGARLDELLRRQAELEETVARLERQLQEGGGSDARRPLAEPEIEAVVTRLLEQRERGAVPGTSPEVSGPTIAAFLRDLGDPALDEAERERIWAQVLESGAIEAVVAAFERQAEARPSDPVAQAQLGTAYLHRLVAAESGPDKGRWGAKGAAALERALELDSANWEARFTLARHFSDAEMHGDALRQFESLIEVQEASPRQAKHAQGYLWLGSLYMNQGRGDEALRTWRDGLRAFPDDEALRARLAAHR